MNVERIGERGSGLVEAVVSIAVASVAACALTGAIASVLHRFDGAALDRALQDATQRETHIAVDVLKYQGAAIVPETIETSVPLAGASPVPVRMTIATAQQSGGAVGVTVTAAASDGHAAQSSAIVAPVPVPGATETASPADPPAQSR